jgi:hypothetical protein
MSETVIIGYPTGNCCRFYSAQAILNYDKEKEFGTVIAESKNKIIIVDDEFKRGHVYLIPKTKVDHFRGNRIYINIPEISLKEFEM